MVETLIQHCTNPSSKNYNHTTLKNSESKKDSTLVWQIVLSNPFQIYVNCEI